MNKNKRSIYNKTYYEKNRERILKQEKEYRERNKEHFLEYRKNYYNEHKDEIYASQQKYIARNRKRITKMRNDYRKRKAVEFKEQGQMYCYLPKTERQNKMVLHLQKRTNKSDDECRSLLIQNNWNIKKIICDLIVGKVHHD